MSRHLRRPKHYDQDEVPLEGGRRRVETDGTEYLTTLASEIRAMYIELRQLDEFYRTGRNVIYRPNNWWDGGLHRGQMRPSIWLQIAEKVFREGLHPAQFLRAQFDAKSLTRRDSVQPNQLLSPMATQRYEALRYKTGELVHGEFICQRNVLEAAVFDVQDGTDLSDDKIRRIVLLDESLDLSPLFRYCLAYKEGLRDIADRYFVAAFSQYRFTREQYDEVWGAWIPRKFRTLADQTTDLCGSLLDGDEQG